MKAYKIKFNFEEVEKESLEFTIFEGDNILDVALENNIKLQHNCGGVCGCSTCHIYINKGMDSLSEISDKEETFIDEANNPRINSRLSCQCILVEGDVEVTIPSQANFLGH